jgi:hypothetical protein
MEIIMTSIKPNSGGIFRTSSSNWSVKGDMTRKEKTKSLLNDVLPSALSRGLDATKLTKSGSAKTSGSGKAQSAGADLDLSGIAEGAGKGSMWGNILGGITGAVDIAMNWGKSTPAKGAASGSAVGAAIGTLFAPGVGTAIGGAIGAIAGGLLGSIKTGKHKDQKARDQVREFLVSNGILASDYTIGLADGSRFNIGIDGGPKKELGGRRPFEVDLSNPMAKYAISWMNPVIALLSQGNDKIHTDFVGYFANAALSNAKSIDDVKANVNGFIEQFGLDDAKIAQGTIEAAKTGLIDEGTAMAWLNGIEERTNPEVKLDLTSSSIVKPTVAPKEQSERTEIAEVDDVEPQLVNDDYEVIVEDGELLAEEDLEELQAA